MGRLIDADESINRIVKIRPANPKQSDYSHGVDVGLAMAMVAIEEQPTIEPERKKDAIQKFHDYQVEWLLSHCDLELEPQLEEWAVRFLHDTANCYMMEIDRGEGEQDG